MRLLIIDPQGAGLDLAMRAQRAWHKVRHFIKQTEKTRYIGRGRGGERAAALWRHTMSDGTPPVSQFDKDIGHWVLGYLMGAGVSCEDAKKVDWRKARGKARADGLEITIHNIGPYLIEAARALTHN